LTPESSMGQGVFCLPRFCRLCLIVLSGFQWQRPVRTHLAWRPNPSTRGFRQQRGSPGPMAWFLGHLQEFSEPLGVLVFLISWPKALSEHSEIICSDPTFALSRI
jgi:hypothetical protein